jgi:hypothetical protein
MGEALLEVATSRRQSCDRGIIFYGEGLVCHNKLISKFVWKYQYLKYQISHIIPYT